MVLQNVEKACCDDQQQAFSCFDGKCAEPTKFTFQRQSILPCRSSPTRKARGSNPPGRTKSSILWSAALFVLRGFYGAVKEEFEQPVPRALRPAGQKRPGGVFLGRGLANPFGRAKKRIAMYFCNALFYSDFRIILVAYHLLHRCTDLLLIVHFSVCL